MVALMINEMFTTRFRDTILHVKLPTRTLVSSSGTKAEKHMTEYRTETMVNSLKISIAALTLDV